MKVFLFAFLLTAAGLVAQGFSPGRYRGDYVGVAVPVGVCSTERWIMLFAVDELGEASGRITDWNGDHVSAFVGRSIDGKFSIRTGTNTFLPPYPDCFPFCPEEPGSGWAINSKVNPKAGTMKGTIDATSKGGCKYTFTLWRRLKNN